MGPAADRGDDRPSWGTGNRVGLDALLERRTVRMAADQDPQAVLQGAVGASVAAARPGRIAQDVLNAQAGQRASDLRGMPEIRIAIR